MKHGKQKKKQSNVRKYYSHETENDDSARCNFCMNVFKHDGNTTNLWRHLERKHSHRVDKKDWPQNSKFYFTESTSNYTGTDADATNSANSENIDHAHNASDSDVDELPKVKQNLYTFKF